MSEKDLDQDNANEIRPNDAAPDRIKWCKFMKWKMNAILIFRSMKISNKKESFNKKNPQKHRVVKKHYFLVNQCGSNFGPNWMVSCKFWNIRFSSTI